MRQRNRDKLIALLYYPLLILPALLFSIAVADVFQLAFSGKTPEEGAISPSRLNQIRWAWTAVTVLVISTVAHAFFRGYDAQKRIVAVSYYGAALVLVSLLLRWLL